MYFYDEISDNEDSKKLFAFVAKTLLEEYDEQRKDKVWKFYNCLL